MNPLAKPFAIFVRGRPGFQVVRESQYAFKAYEFARAELAEHWSDYGIGFSDCVVEEVEEVGERERVRA